MANEEKDARIETGSIYDPPDVPYLRYLVSRRWPSGITRDAIDQWDRELAPSTLLLDAWRAGDIDDTAFEARYETELNEHPGLLKWAVNAATNGIVLVDDAVDELAPRNILASIIRRCLSQMQDPTSDRM